jgi:AraC-like DNA-binding protein
MNTWSGGGWRGRMTCLQDPSLAEIAVACGFADQSHFTAAFRKATGVTPGRVRREKS